MISMIKDGFSIYFTRQMLVIALISFASAIPFTILHSGINTWLAIEGVEKSTIGLFSFLSLPYTLKFVIAPFLDSLELPWIGKLGKRLSWMILMQVCVSVSIILMALFGPSKDLSLFAVLALLVAFFSSAQDIVIDAYRTEIVEQRHQGAVASIAILAYRVGMLCAGGFALMLIDYLCSSLGLCGGYINWVLVLSMLSFLLLIAPCAVFFYGDPSVSRSVAMKEKSSSVSIPVWFVEVVSVPFKDFASRISRWWLAALFIVLYRSCDAFIGLMLGPFLIDMGFSLMEIGKVIKSFGFLASVLGGFIGGFLVQKLGIKKSLYICGVFQMASNLVFIMQYARGYDLEFLYVAIAVENVCAGMASIAFVAYAMSICSKRYAATQYALMTSLAALDKLVMGTFSGLLVECLGWDKFFCFSACLGLPPLVMIYFLYFADSEPSAKRLGW